MKIEYIANQVRETVKKYDETDPVRLAKAMNIYLEYSNAIVHAFQKFKAPFSGKIVHIFPEQSAVI